MGNYYGINFSDGSHVEHGIRDAWANHKYKARKWVNGAWQYIYDDYQSAKQQDRNLHYAQQKMESANDDAHNYGLKSGQRHTFIDSRTGRKTTANFTEFKLSNGKTVKSEPRTVKLNDRTTATFTKTLSGSDRIAKQVSLDAKANTATNIYKAQLNEYKKNKKGKFFKAVDTFLNKFGLSIF